MRWTNRRPVMRAERLTLSGLALCAMLLPWTAYSEMAVQQFDSDTDRTPVHTVIPEYPKVARRDRIEGEVQVCFEITREGQTRRIAVRRSTHRLFEKPAKRAVRASTFKPLPKHVDVPPIKACRTFRFSLEPVEKDDG